MFFLLCLAFDVEYNSNNISNDKFDVIDNNKKLIIFNPLSDFLVTKSSATTKINLSNQTFNNFTNNYQHQQHNNNSNVIKTNKSDSFANVAANIVSQIANTSPHNIKSKVKKCSKKNNKAKVLSQNIINKSQKNTKQEIINDKLKKTLKNSTNEKTAVLSKSFTVDLTLKNKNKNNSFLRSPSTISLESSVYYSAVNSPQLKTKHSNICKVMPFTSNDSSDTVKLKTTVSTFVCDNRKLLAEKLGVMCSTPQYNEAVFSGRRKRSVLSTVNG